MPAASCATPRGRAWPTRWCRHGAPVTAAALSAAEQKATRDIDDAHTVGSTDDRARGWLYFNLVLKHAGVEQNHATDAALVELREYHRHDNLWEHVEPDVLPALAALKDRGLRLVVGVERERPPQSTCSTASILTKWFDHVLDSHEWGVEKPDPRLFQARARAVARRRRRGPCTSATSITSMWWARAGRTARRRPVRHGGLYEDVDCPRVTRSRRWSNGSTSRAGTRRGTACPDLRRRDAQRRAMAAHDAAHRGHAEPASLILRREERIEHARQRVLVHARPLSTTSMKT
jgi:hypothetical protein